jgi:hypothetical protein
MTANGVTHALTWRPARALLGESVGLWDLYTPEQYFDSRHCGHDGPFAYDVEDVPQADLTAWVATQVGFPVELEAVDPPQRNFGDTNIETRFWVRSAA